MSGRLRERLSESQLLTALCVGRLAHHNLIQAAAVHGRYDAMWFDLEHTAMTISDVEIAATICRAHGLESFCRIPPSDYSLVARCLETGVGGVMAAQIHDVAQAEQFAQWCRFYPKGNRGLNLGGLDSGYGSLSAAEYCPQANASVAVGIQIETLGALRDCEHIALLDEVDFLFLGPADLSQSLGVPGDYMHEECVAAVKQIAAACDAAEKPWAAVTFNPEHAAFLISCGCDLISPAADIRVFTAGLQAIQDRYPDLFGRENG